SASCSLLLASACRSPLSLHDALPISPRARAPHRARQPSRLLRRRVRQLICALSLEAGDPGEVSLAAHHRVQLDRPGSRYPDLLRSEEHTSELQSRENLVCRLLLEKKE